MIGSSLLLSLLPLAACASVPAAPRPIAARNDAVVLEATCGPTQVALESHYFNALAADYCNSNNLMQTQTFTRDGDYRAGGQYDGWKFAFEFTHHGGLLCEPGLSRCSDAMKALQTKCAAVDPHHMASEGSVSVYCGKISYKFTPKA